MLKFDLEPTARRPVYVRVNTEYGEIIEFTARSTSAALGKIRRYVSEGYWGKPVRMEWKYHPCYREAWE